MASPQFNYPLPCRHKDGELNSGHFEWCKCFPCAMTDLVHSASFRHVLISFFLVQVENVKLLDRYTNKKSANGTLYLTATHLIYVDTSADIRKETWVLHHHIATVEKLPLSASGCQLQIRCKNFRVARFLMVQERDCHEVYTSLLKLSQPVKPEELYAFSYNPKMPEGSRETGWKSIDVKADYLRMGIDSSSWEISNVCSTYSRELVVPKVASRAMILGSAKFRSRGRIPVLSYFYKENNAAICRCSQPLSGFSTRCLEDEQLLQAIREAKAGTAGKGYENVDNYDCIRFKFISIENIHVMRSSLQKLLEVCEAKSPSMSDFLTGLENSGWLRHIKAVMDAGVFLAKAVRNEGASVVVHCSDGWDRTAQVCSLACLLLDPFYRTLKGFMVLIEKEWIVMGHKFSHSSLNAPGSSCNSFLVRLNSTSGCFLKFMIIISEKTHSLWPFLLQRKLEFRNPLYKGYTAYTSLQPNTLPFSFQFWCGMYNRFDKGMHPKQCILDHLLSCTSQNLQMENNTADLEHKLLLSDGLLPNETPAFSKGVASSLDSSTSPMVNTPQDYDTPVLLANGAIARKEGNRPDGQVISEVGLTPPTDTPNGNGCSPSTIHSVPLWGSDQADLQRA
ncbi:hypothetical protein E2320_012889 [Naja naja]|nr:hypothetical protein E2320_012889 [Naja naja]